MKAIDRSFMSIINGTSQFVIPVFQRDYTWQAERQCAQLWRDVLRAATSGQKHFLGSVVYIPTDDSSAGFTRWLLIDGQQRMTTLAILLIALRDHIRATGWVGTESDPTAKRIDAYFLKNMEEDGDRHHKLVLRRHDQATLAGLLDGAEVPPEASQFIRENYRYFMELFENGASPSDVYKGIGCLQIVDVALDRQIDDPQLIFESLNSTGVRLSQSDLIRNFILMRLPEKEQTRLYETYWSKLEKLFKGSEWTFDAFARDFVAFKTEASKQEKAAEIYYAFREFFPALQETCGGLDQALAEILRYARHYAAFTLGRGVAGEREVPLGDLRHLVEIPAILVMRLLECRDHLRTMGEPELLEALRLIESYVLRRAVCRYQTRAYWQIFASLAYKVGDASPLTDLKVGLARLRDSSRFPSDDEFERALKENDLYELRVCKHLLEGLENHNSKELTDTSTYSIEHIMPQNERLSTKWRDMLGAEWKEVHKTWVDRLGNLTLTGYNSKYSDRPFSEKKTIEGGFEESSVRLNKFVREQSVWTLTELSKRTDELAHRAVECWGALQVPQSLIDAANRREMKELAARRDVTKVVMSQEARDLFEALPNHVMALDADILELAEPKSVSYHSRTFFLEVLPRRYSLTLLLALDFNEVDNPAGLAQDATQREFFVNARHEGGVAVSVTDAKTIDGVMPLIAQAYQASLE